MNSDLHKRLYKYHKFKKLVLKCDSEINLCSVDAGSEVYIAIFDKLFEKSNLMAISNLSMRICLNSKGYVLDGWVYSNGRVMVNVTLFEVDLLVSFDFRELIRFVISNDVLGNHERAYLYNRLSEELQLKIIEKYPRRSFRKRDWLVDEWNPPKREVLDLKLVTFISNYLQIMYNGRLCKNAKKVKERFFNVY